MNIRKYIRENVRKMLNENFGPQALVDFDSFPESVRKTLFDEYGDFQFNFDWNEKNRELGDGFNEWRIRNKQIQFLNNLDLIIKKTTQDLILLKKRKISSNQLQAFEELILPALGTEVLSTALTKYEELVILSPNLSPQEMEMKMRDAKNLLNPDGSIDSTKMELSQLFTGGDLNIPNFQRFVEKNPEYRGVYNDWKKLYDKDFTMNFETELHAFRSSTSEARIKELRDFLIQFKQYNLN